MSIHESDLDLYFRSRIPTSCITENEKADVAEHSKVSGHVGLLVNQPPGKAELPFI